MEQYLVSARKYRPSTFETVVAQESVTETLKNAIRSNHIAHAYLFCGPRGVGKTTCARIFAKTINCTNLSSEIEPCGQCESCLAFDEQRSFNIHEFDAASNNSVNDIKNLIDIVRIPPQIGRYSVYIIDEVHMLSTTAFNAFLKTLEEPPAHAVFIMATTERHKIPATILSRCQVFDFQRIGINDIVSNLEKIALAENINYDRDGLVIIAQKSDGAMRDALSLFDQISSFSDRNVVYSQVIKSLNILDYDYYFRMTGNVIKGDYAGSLLLLDEILKKGFDGQTFLTGFSSHFRDLLVSRDKVTLSLLDVGDNIRRQYLEQSSVVPEEYIFKALDICDACDVSYRTSKNQRLHVELALLRLCMLAGIPGIEHRPAEPASTVAQATTQQKKTADAPSVAQSQASDSQSVNVQNANPADNTRSANPAGPKSISIKSALKGVRTNVGEHTEQTFEDLDLTKLDWDLLHKAWKKVAVRYERSNPRAMVAMKDNMPVVDGDSLVCTASTQIQFDSLQEVREDIEKTLSSELKARVGLRIRLDDQSEDTSKVYTLEDRFARMKEQNPSLSQLCSTFGLEIS